MIDLKNFDVPSEGNFPVFPFLTLSDMSKEESMHKTGIRSYTGAPGEQVTVTATVAGSGSVKFVLNGQDMGNTSPLVFNLPRSAGQASKLSVGLFGAVGDTCLVDISTVDGGSDKDLLVAQPHDPFPVHDYDFVALAPTQLAMASSLNKTKGGK
jgi:hypothetical protein